MQRTRNLVALTALFTSTLLALSLVGACGSRTGLFVEIPEDAANDTTVDSPLDSFDAPPDRDAGLDAEAEADVAIDAPEAAADVDAEADVVIGCVPRSCAELGYNCGENGNGCGQVQNCGTCPPPEVCGAQKYSQCAMGPPCKPKTCQDLGFNCGPAGDGCGGMLQCGICQYPDVCGGAGMPGRCGNSLPCTNLCKQQTTCDSGTTSVTGTVFAATPPQFGTADPVYNALVYVPNAPVLPFKPGVQCAQCGADVSGQPLVATQTAADGTFTLTNMPVGANIPLVIQIGRWRRQVVIPNVPACTSTALPADLTRLPRNQMEGDIPLIAVATGNADGTECVLWKMGIDQAEFTQPNGGGRVHIYISNGANAGMGTPDAGTLWNSPPTLANYDLVVMPCEGMPLPKAPTAQQNIIDYTSAGGRVFTTHYGYTWLYNDPPFNMTAQWNPNASGSDMTTTGVVDTSGLKGQALATWLQTVGATIGPNELTIAQPRQDTDSINPPSERFIFDMQAGYPLLYAFYTPVGAPPSQQCGRVVYPDFHVASQVLTGGKTFPAECATGPLDAQEKALEFMLFDLASCIPAVPQNCTPQTCQQQGIQCGPAGDGCGMQIDCGMCTPPDTCGGSMNFQCGTPDAGMCVPKTCQDLGFNCGLNGDGCGNVIDCGMCPPGKICGIDKPSVCGP